MRWALADCRRSAVTLVLAGIPGCLPVRGSGTARSNRAGYRSGRGRLSALRPEIRRLPGSSRCIEVTLRETAGSLENLQMLSALTPTLILLLSREASQVVPIPTLSWRSAHSIIEPLWLFVRRGLRVSRGERSRRREGCPSARRGQRHACCRQHLARRARHRCTMRPISPVSNRMSWRSRSPMAKLDAAFVIADPDADVIADLLRTSAAGFAQPGARRLRMHDAHPYLTSISSAGRRA